MMYHSVSALSLLLLVGTAVGLPVTETTQAETCTQRSGKVKDWTVIDFDFHSSYIFTNPAHQNSWGYVNFTLGNQAVDYKGSCTAQSNQLQDFFYGTQVFTCQLPNTADHATFTFSRPSGELLINQTWNCASEGSRFEARGGVKLDLKCSDKFWQNPDWKPGQFYSTRIITCDHVTTKAPITQISGVA